MVLSKDDKVSYYDASSVSYVSTVPKSSHFSIVDRCLLNAHVAQDKDKHSLVESVNCPDGKVHESELQILEPDFVIMLRALLDELLFRNFPVKESVCHNWDSCEAHIIELIYDWLVKSLSRESRPRS